MKNLPVNMKNKYVMVIQVQVKVSLNKKSCALVLRLIKRYTTDVNDWKLNALHTTPIKIK